MCPSGFKTLRSQSSEKVAVFGSQSNCLRLALACAGSQLGLHAWFAVGLGDPRMFGPHAMAWLLDLLVLLVGLGALCGLGSVLQSCRVPAEWWKRACSGLIFILGLGLASYPGQLTEFLAFPVSVFHADLATASFFVTEYLGWRGLWPVAASAAAMLLATRWRWPLPSVNKLALASVAVVLLSVFPLLHPAPHPFVYAVQDALRSRLAGGRRSVTSLTRPTASLAKAPSLADALFPLEHLETVAYNHVLMIVFETVAADDFERGFLTRPQGYYARLRERSAYFSCYHATNLDSYTSLIAMLTAVQVPYRAYANPGSYEPVNAAPNVVAALHRCGYQGLFLCTAENQPFVPVRSAWSRVLGARDMDLQPGWVTVGESKVEAAVEDRAALPAILEFVKSHSRTLVMHELVFGHSPRWIAKTGQEQLAYYDRYLLELTSGLERAGLADDCLLVVVADHGDRADSARAQNYRVPLLISGRNVPSGRNSLHLSHCDLPAILGHYLAGRPLPQARPSLLTVGSTERWIYGEITSAGGCLFIDNDRGAVLASQGSLDAVAVQRRFQTYLNAFAAKYSR